MKKLNKQERLVIVKKIIEQIKEEQKQREISFLEKYEVEIEKLVTTIQDDINKLSGSGQEYFINMRGYYEGSQESLFHRPKILTFAQRAIKKTFNYQPLTIPGIQKVEDALIFAQMDAENLTELMESLKNQFC